MIKYMKGNLFETGFDANKNKVVICNFVDCNDEIDSEIMNTIRKEHKDIYDCYKNKCNSIRNGVGTDKNVQYINCKDSHGFVIANIFAVENVNRHIFNIKDLDKAFDTIANDFKDYRIRICDFSKCDGWQGNWMQVLDSIKKLLSNNGIEVEVYMAGTGDF